MVEDDDAPSGSLLVVLLETHPAAWRALAGGSAVGDDVKSASTSTSTSSSMQTSVSPPALVAAVAAFVGAYELEAEDNSVVVLAVHGGKCPVLYRSPWLRDEAEQAQPLNPIAERLASAVASLIEEDIKTMESETSPPPPSPSPALSPALARALCLCSAADRPTAGEAEILSAEPAEGAEPHGGGAGIGAAGGAAAAGAAAPTSAAAGAPSAAEGARRAKPRPRVLVLASTPAAGESYIPLMNCAFAAQRLGVSVDVCELVEGAATGGAKKKKDDEKRKKKSFAGGGGGGGGWATVDGDNAAEKQKESSAGEKTSTLLSQVAHLTGGLVVSPPSLLLSSSSSNSPSQSSSTAAAASASAAAAAASLLECLLSVFAPSGRVRRWLSLPMAGAVDMRASCFCHKRPIDVGFVCSVCLSIFCETKAACSTCGADFGGGEFSAGDKRPAGGTTAATAGGEARPRLG